ncbi:hypothetical protein TNCV_2451091 [Trichonephila clavipes]|nr:hypothetical protein TNCV_2451091 [Trichonephila clavipes]
MFGSRSLQLDERRQASRRSFEEWILTSRKVFSEEAERVFLLAVEKFNILKDNEGRRKQHSRSFMARREPRVFDPQS